MSGKNTIDAPRNSGGGGGSVNNSTTVVGDVMVDFTPIISTLEALCDKVETNNLLLIENNQKLDELIACFTC